MVTIKQSTIIDLIVKHYQQQLKESTYHIYQFQQQYNCSLAELEQQIKDSDTEVPGKWEDYISWKGHQQSATHLTMTIKQIKDGLFEVAQG